MTRVRTAKWRQALDDLRHASVHAGHPRSRGRLPALYLIAAGHFNATACAAHVGRRDEADVSIHAHPEGQATRRTTADWSLVKAFQSTLTPKGKPNRP